MNNSHMFQDKSLAECHHRDLSLDPEQSRDTMVCAAVPSNVLNDFELLTEQITSQNLTPPQATPQPPPPTLISRVLHPEHAEE